MPVSSNDLQWKIAGLEGQAQKHAEVDARSAVKMLEELERMLRLGRYDEATKRLQYLIDTFLPTMLKDVAQAKIDNPQGSAK